MGIDPEKIRGAITVYRQRRSGAYQIQPMSRYGRLGLADAGETISVAPREDAPLLAVVEMSVFRCFDQALFRIIDQGLARAA